MWIKMVEQSGGTVIYDDVACNGIMWSQLTYDSVEDQNRGKNNGKCKATTNGRNSNRDNELTVEVKSQSCKKSFSVYKIFEKNLKQ